MAIFQWKGLEGSQMNSGEIEARNADEAGAKLREKKVVVTNLVLISGKEEASITDGAGSEENNDEDAAPVSKHAGHKIKKIKTKDLMIFTKKFATMVQAGLPILKTMKMLEEQQENPNFQWIVKCVKEDIEGGSTLSEAFAQFPTVFDTVYVNLIKAGESSGKLTLFLYKLVAQIEKSEKIKKKVKGALSYPIILLCVAFAVIAIMMVKVVPVFQGMFSSMGHGLPGPTQLIVDISMFCRDPMKGGLLIGVLIAAFIGTKILIRKNINVKRKFDRLALKLPIIGDIIQKSSLAKIAMVQGNLSAAGVGLVEALKIVSKTMTNTRYTDAFDIIEDGIQSGNSLSSLYSTCDVFPKTFYQLLEVGEETGNMDEMFEATAMFYEEEFDMSVDRLTEALEPIMIVFMGLTVGFIIVAMYMPIFKMGEMVSG